jgi:phosphoribosylglycinamide formyltransferase-1
MSKLKIAVLLSGSGRTLDNFHKKIQSGELNCEIVAVGSSSANALGVAKAKKYGYPVMVANDQNHKVISNKLNNFILQFHPDLICLAGFMKLYTIPEGFEGKVLNIHPALIPAFCGKGFYGMKVHKAVIKAGVKVTGCTVHIVSEKYDEGPILLQKCVPVLENDTQETVAKRVFDMECELYPEAINLFANNKIKIIDNKTYIKR